MNAIAHFTDWIVAHVHVGALGWNGFMTFGILYWLIPRLFQTKLYSEKFVKEIGFELHNGKQLLCFTTI